MRQRLLVCFLAAGLGSFGQSSGTNNPPSPNLSKPGSDHPMPLPKATPDAPPAARKAKPGKEDKKQTRSRKSDESKQKQSKRPKMTR